MDDDLTTLEAELQRLRPLSPRPAVRAGIERQLTRGYSRRALITSWARWALPAAAMIALAFVLWSVNGGTRRAAVPPAAGLAGPSPQFNPVSADNVLVSARDEGVVVLRDGTPARRFRQISVDSITWKNAATNASLVWTVPREEVRVVPISYQ